MFYFVIDFLTNLCLKENTHTKHNLLIKNCFLIQLKFAFLKFNMNKTIFKYLSFYKFLVPKPGYGLTSPNKSITLPNSARYIGMVIKKILLYKIFFLNNKIYFIKFKVNPS